MELKNLNIDIDSTVNPVLHWLLENKIIIKNAGCEYAKSTNSLVYVIRTINGHTIYLELFMNENGECTYSVANIYDHDKKLVLSSDRELSMLGLSYVFHEINDIIYDEREDD